MPAPDEHSLKEPEEKTMTENGLLVALCVAAAIAGYFFANFVSRWMLEIG
jgi:hypothetical protein